MDSTADGSHEIKCAVIAQGIFDRSCFLRLRFIGFLAARLLYEHTQCACGLVGELSIFKFSVLL